MKLQFSKSLLITISLNFLLENLSPGKKTSFKIFKRDLLGAHWETQDRKNRRPKKGESDSLLFGSQNVVHCLGVSASSGNFLEMQNLRSQPRPTISVRVLQKKRSSRKQTQIEVIWI